MQRGPSRRTFIGGLLAAASATACALPPKQPPATGAIPTATAGPATPIAGSTTVPVTTPVATTPADGYVVVSPSALGANNREEIAVSLLTGNRPTAGPVTLELRQNTTVVAQASGTIHGHGT